MVEWCGGEEDHEKRERSERCCCDEREAGGSERVERERAKKPTPTNDGQESLTVK